MKNFIYRIYYGVTVYDEGTIVCRDQVEFANWMEERMDYLKQQHNIAHLICTYC
jgi:hypothetical protein